MGAETELNSTRSKIQALIPIVNCLSTEIREVWSNNTKFEGKASLMTNVMKRRTENNRCSFCYTARLRGGALHRFKYRVFHSFKFRRTRASSDVYELPLATELMLNGTLMRQRKMQWRKLLPCKLDLCHHAQFRRCLLLMTVQFYRIDQPDISNRTASLRGHRPAARQKGSLEEKESISALFVGEHR